MPIPTVVLFRAVVTPALLLAAVAAQGPAADRVTAANAPLPTLAWPTDRVLTDTTPQGVVWAATAGWKAAFARDGATFTPFLGSDAPSHNVTFRLAAAHLAGQPLPLFDSAPPVERNQRISYDRGAVVESFDLRQDGLEQEFVLRELGNRGELVLDVAVDTPLAAHHDAGGFTFAGVAGGVHYGAAVAIDAAGNRLPLATEWTGGKLQITVPAGFVAAAALPLVIDPMIGSATVMSPSTAELKSTDIAFDHSLGQYYVTYERSFSVTDHDVYVAYFDASMVYQGLLTIDYTSEYWSKPRIATLEGNDVGCVVAEASTGNVAPFQVRGRLFTGGAAPTLSTAFSRGSSSGDCLDPDVGGDSNAAGGANFLVVHEQTDSAVNNSSLAYCIVHPDGSYATVGTLSTSIGFDRRPAISKTCGTIGGGTEGWVIVFRLELYQQSSGRLCALFVDRNGQQRWVNGPAFAQLTMLTPNNGSEWAVSSPTDHALGRRFLCVERRFDSAVQRGNLVGHAFDRNGVVIDGEVPITQNAYDRRLPAVDCDGARFGIAFDVAYSPQDHDIRAATWALVGGQLVQHEVVATTTATDFESSPAICAARGAGANTFGMAWVHAMATSWRLEAQLYHGIRSGGFVSRSTGCGGLSVVASGFAAIGETFQLQRSDASGLGGFVLGLPVNLPIGACPGCAQGASGSTLLGSQILVAVPAVPEFVGITLAVQSFRFAASGLPCLGQLAVSNTLDFTIQ